MTVTIATVEDSKEHQNRAVAVTGTGRIWKLITSPVGGSGLQIFHSDNDGATWVDYTATLNAIDGFSATNTNASGSLFVDQDDHLWVAAVTGSSVKVQRFSNASGTLSDASEVSAQIDSGSPSAMRCEIVAWREGAGHRLVAAAPNVNNSTNYGYANLASEIMLPDGTWESGTSFWSKFRYDYRAFTSTIGHASLDFEHTGDGITPAREYPRAFYNGSAHLTQGSQFYTHMWTGTTYANESGSSSSSMKSAAGVFARSIWWSIGIASSSEAIYFYKLLPRLDEVSIPTPPAPTATHNVNLAYDPLSNVLVALKLEDGLSFCRFDLSTEIWESAWTSVGTTGVTTTDRGELSAPRVGAHGIPVTWEYDSGGTTYTAFDYIGRVEIPTVTSPTDNSSALISAGIDLAWTHNDAVAQAGIFVKRRSAVVPEGHTRLEYGPEEWWDGTSWVGVESEVAGQGATTTLSISSWGPQVDGDTCQIAISTLTSEDWRSPYSDWVTINPYEWWNGTSWVPMVETSVASATSSVTLTGAEADHDPQRYEWAVSTHDENEPGPYSAFSEYEVKEVSPTLVSPIDVTLGPKVDATYDWTHNGADAQSEYALVRRQVL